MRKLLLLLLVLTLSAFAAAPKKTTKQKAKTPPPPVAVAPAEFTHPMALLLKDLSQGGTRQVTFRATAVGTRFFFEEKAGVTVYRFTSGKYTKETFLRGSTLARAVKQYDGRV
ncbi:MAG TPA: hypothetical protein VE974_21460 [Thermoanaerobaculia bacterium]|nr:hypothetical protein [Thermoanaerobaculia bacterium]